MEFGTPFVATPYFQPIFSSIICFLIDLCMVWPFPLFTIVTENLTKSTKSTVCSGFTHSVSFFLMCDECEWTQKCNSVYKVKPREQESRAETVQHWPELIHSNQRGWIVKFSLLRSPSSIVHLLRLEVKRCAIPDKDIGLWKHCLISDRVSD